MGIKKSVVSPGAIVKANSDLQSLAKSIGRVVNGNKSTTGASAGQFVVLLSSTISGRADGLYTAAKAIPANTAIDSSYLTASESGLNALNTKIANTAKAYYESKFCDAQAGTLTMTLPAGLYMFEVHAKTQWSEERLSITFENEAAYYDSFAQFILPVNADGQVLSYDYCFLKDITTDRTVTFSYSANWYKISVYAIRLNP